MEKQVIKLEPLTEKDRMERGELIAEKILRVEKLREEKKEKQAEMQQLIDHELDEIARLSRVLVDAAASARQKPLEFSEEEAAKAIVEVASESAKGARKE